MLKSGENMRQLEILHPREFEAKFDELAARFGGAADKIACFDLDGTLIRHDMGEAVFARMKAGGRDLPLSWKQYQEMIREGKSIDAYREMAACMAGIAVAEIEKATAEVMQSENSLITFPERKTEISIPVPKPFPWMQNFTEFLAARGFDLYIVSASNDISVKTAAKAWFGIPEENAFGIACKSITGKWTDEIIEPAPAGPGKKDVIKQKIGKKPLITAGDSINDRALFLETAEDGIIIISGDSSQSIESIRLILRGKFDIFAIHY